MLRGCLMSEREEILKEYAKTHGNSKFMLDIVSYPLMFDEELKKAYQKLADAYMNSKEPSAGLVVKLQHAGTEVKNRRLEKEVRGLRRVNSCD